MVAETATLWTCKERLSALSTVVAAILSLIATLSVLAYAGFRFAGRPINTWPRLPIRPLDPERPNPTNNGLFINLMLMDFLQALAALVNLKWIQDAGITVGPMCSAQGALKHISSVGVATASLAIAVHAFSILAFDWAPPSRKMIAAVWGFVAFNVAIPLMVHGRHGLYGPAGYWCWIRTEYKWIQMFNEYFWEWLDGLVMIIIYTFMFLVLTRWLIIENGRIYYHQNAPQGRHEPQQGEGAAIMVKERAIAGKLVYYPVVYIVWVLPNSLARWRYFTGHHTPYQVILFTHALYILSGLLDVALFLVHVFNK